MSMRPVKTTREPIGEREIIAWPNPVAPVIGQPERRANVPETGWNRVRAEKRLPSLVAAGAFCVPEERGGVDERTRYDVDPLKRVDLITLNEPRCNDREERTHVSESGSTRRDPGTC